MVFVSKVIVFSVNATCSYLSLVLACSLPTSDHFPFACTLLAREIAKVAIPMKILHQAALSVKVADGVRLHPFRSIRRSSPWKTLVGNVIRNTAKWGSILVSLSNSLATSYKVMEDANCLMMACCPTIRSCNRVLSWVIFVFAKAGENACWSRFGFINLDISGLVTPRPSTSQSLSFDRVSIPWLIGLSCQPLFELWPWPSRLYPLVSWVLLDVVVVAIPPYSFFFFSISLSCSFRFKLSMISLVSLVFFLSINAFLLTFSWSKTAWAALFAANLSLNCCILACFSSWVSSLIYISWVQRQNNSLCDYSFSGFTEILVLSLFSWHV